MIPSEQRGEHKLDRLVPMGDSGVCISLAVYPAGGTNAFFAIFPLKELKLLMASYTTGDFLRLLSECRKGVYKYPAGTVYPTRPAGGLVILASDNPPNTNSFFLFFNIVRVE